MWFSKGVYKGILDILIFVLIGICIYYCIILYLMLKWVYVIIVYDVVMLKFMGLYYKFRIDYMY